MAQFQLLVIMTSLLLQISAVEVAAEPAAAGFGSGPSWPPGVDALSGDKRYMRFGRGGDINDWNGYLSDGEVLDKRYMRFGRTPEDDEEVQNADKRYMRFGRDKEKRYMRFGRDPAEEKRYMRFGRDHEDEKRYMRFGRSYESEEKSPWQEHDKSSKADEVSDEEGVGKRYMRFGKRSISDEGSTHEDKRYMRFGKKSDAAGMNDAWLSSDKRYMRFGR